MSENREPEGETERHPVIIRRTNRPQAAASQEQVDLISKWISKLFREQGAMLAILAFLGGDKVISYVKAPQEIADLRSTVTTLKEEVAKLSELKEEMATLSKQVSSLNKALAEKPLP